ncbi:serine hydrolase domain-containing protein [Nonomuraea africana]|uniref:D-alanyl-D-alanine carboxypeptidase n=1 Tax=Nonomuraea africana TaxID=46171 RepID=A0ABR9KJZ2_9ACTN|nr:serine hydrolase domain-containing protein [Nonomuraea africana]MBE1562140.1 D-alanyl-D-alanine carboxypeptidase [Nonomuraea africana]
MLHKSLTAVALVATTLVGLSPVAAAAEPPKMSLQQQLEKSVTVGVAGMQVRVIRNGTTSFGAAGVSQLGTTQPVALDGRFRIGSITKMFVATRVLMLVGDSKLDLDAPAYRYLPNVLNPQDHGAITVRMLLGHTNGLATYLDLLPLFTGGPDEVRKARFTHYTARELVDMALKRPADFAPGTKWAYSNTGYLLLGMLIENVTGEHWSKQVTKHILQPLRMKETFIPGDSTRIPGKHAHGYHQGLDITRLNPSFGGAAGEMISTTADLDIFQVALTSGKLISPRWLAEARKPGAHNKSWGLGVVTLPTSCGITMYGHTGGIPGYQSFSFASADSKHRVNGSVTVGKSGPQTEEHAFATVDAAVCG